MTRDTHNTIQPNTKEDGDASTPGVTPDSFSDINAKTSDSKPQKKVVDGALNKALMRTFRGDIAEQLGEGSDSVADTLIPKKNPSVSTNSSTTNDEDTSKSTYPDESVKERKSIVHTFRGDVQNLIRNRKMSLTKMVALEGDRVTDTPLLNEAIRPWKIAVKVSLILFFLVIITVIASGSYYFYKLNTTPTSTYTFEPSILFTEKKLGIDVTTLNGFSLLGTLNNARSSAAFSLGIIVDLYLTRGSTTSKEQTTPTHLSSIGFLSRIQAHVSDDFLRSLTSKYMVGIYTTGNGNIPFIVLKTNSYNYAFSGMLLWEKKMLVDLSPFFPQYIPKNSTLATPTFSDAVIENMDVREMRSATGSLLLLYSFVNQNTIVITTDPRVLIEISNRIRTKQ